MPNESILIVPHHHLGMLCKVVSGAVGAKQEGVFLEDLTVGQQQMYYRTPQEVVSTNAFPQSRKGSFLIELVEGRILLDWAG